MAKESDELARRCFDAVRARDACRYMDQLRKDGAFAAGKTSTEIIREWRDTRK